MGLDNFWEVPDPSKAPKFKPKLHLCGGLCSDNGTGSFRGKVYSEVIEGVSGISLYQEVITNEQVKLIADSLQDTEYKHAKKYSGWDLTKEEYADLVRMFTQYAKAGAILKSWW